MRIEAAYDYASPWAFLAAASARERFAGLEVTYLPTYLRGFDSFRDGVPYSPQKLTYLLRDFERQAELLGVAVKTPSHFPINGVHALRGAIVAQREGAFEAYHRAAFAAAWQEDRNISSPDVIREIAREIGAPAIADRLGDQDVKDALRANTERALERGAFGVPTFFVGDQLFWGQDRMKDAARFARGGEVHRAPRTHEEAWAYARRWASAWSGLDVEGVLDRFAEDVVFTSPLAKQVTGSARVEGKAALRAYWATAVKAIKTMRFYVVDVAWSPTDRRLAIVYDRMKDGVLASCAEHLRFGDPGADQGANQGKVVEGKAFHGA